MNKLERPVLKGAKVLNDFQYYDGSYIFPINIFKKISKEFVNHFKKTSIEIVPEPIEEPIEEPIPEKVYTEFEKTILYKITKIFNIDEEYIKKYLRDNIYSHYWLSRDLKTIISGNFKFNMWTNIEVGIYDKTEPELYENILSIYSFDGKEISIFYKSGIWDEDFLKTLDDILEERETERLKKIIEEKDAEQVKQERIRKMFEKPLDKEKSLD